MNTIRPTMLGVALALSVANVDAQVDWSEKVELHVEGQALRDALIDWAQQTGYQVVLPTSELANTLIVPPIDGPLSPEAALRRLLMGTPLGFEWLNERTVAIRERPKRMSSSTSWAMRSGQVLRIAESTLQPAQEPKPEKPNADRALKQEAIHPAESSPEHSLQAVRYGLEEIIVTAQKREQALIDVPITITALSGEHLEQAGVNNVQDLSFSVPSMSTAEIGPGRQLITLRGMGGQRGSSSLVGVYLDEIPMSGLQDGFVATYSDVGTADLDRVEVLKGPQGTLFGEGSVGGTVRFITADPDLTAFGGKLSGAMYGNERSGDLSGELRGVLNVPLATDKFALRIAGTYENKAGWIDKVQTVDGPVIERDFNDNELFNVRVKGLWMPTDRLILKGTVVVHRSEGGGSNLVNLEPRSGSWFIIEFDPTAPTRFTDDYDLYNLTGTYDFGFAELLSSTSYSTKESVASLMQRKPLIPAPNPGVQELLIPEYVQDGFSFSQELRLSSKDRGPFDWTLGAYYNDSELAYRAGFDFARFGQVIVRNSGGDVEPTFTSKSWAVFGDASYALTPRLSIGGGIRYFEDDRETYDALAADVSSTLLEGRFDSTTFRTYASLELAEGVKMHGSVSKGFRSGGFNGVSVASLGAPATYDPESATSYELGVKMALMDRRLNVQAALFYSKYEDIQMNSVFVAGNGSPVGYTGNPGEAEIQGFEWEFYWAASDRLSLMLGGDIIDTEITKVDPRVQPAQFEVGDPIDFVPEYSVTASAAYTIDWSPSTPGYVRLVYNQQGRSTSTLRTLGALQPITQTPILNFMHASIGLAWNGWGLELFGRNLLNEDGALRTGSIEPQARPRTVGLRFDKSF